MTNVKTAKLNNSLKNTNRRTKVIKSFNESKYLLLLLLPGLIWYIVFCYIPMYGIQIGFKNYTFNKGIWGSAWVGLSHFRRMFALNDFWTAVKNTVFISFGRLLFEFPLPIVLAILVNELRSNKIKRIYQTIYTFPNFISWVVAYTLFYSILSGEGSINLLLSGMGLDTIDFFSDSRNFLVLIFGSSAWKSMGWTSIIYSASIANINPELYEAATVDGANRIHKIMYITLPELVPTIIALFILAVGNSMNAGFDQIFNLYNPMVYNVADIIDTYVYRMGFESSTGFSFSTAVGLFKSIINFVLIILTDRIAKACGQSGIF
mgnify:CR=1 FL=1